MIYFIATPDRSRIKIGTTIRLSERLRQLAREHGDGLEVLAVVEGDREIEKGLHRRFAHLRVVKEWFEPGDDLLGFIVSDGKPWDGTDDAPLEGIPVRIEADIQSMAKYIAASRGVPVAKLVSDLLRPAVEKEFHKLGQKLIKGAPEAGGSPN